MKPYSSHLVKPCKQQCDADTLRCAVLLPAGRRCG
jgi:hypothetical protein